MRERGKRFPLKVLSFALMERRLQEAEAISLFAVDLAPEMEFGVNCIFFIKYAYIYTYVAHDLTKVLQTSTLFFLK